jgi:hypothetical protein
MKDIKSKDPIISKKNLIDQDDDYWIFTNGIKYSKNRYKQRLAEKVYLTLSNCKNCINCEDCNDCINCNKCYRSANLINCSDCNKCFICKECKNSINCLECRNCNNCSDCQYCKSCLDCKDCFDCDGCRSGFGKENVRLELKEKRKYTKKCVDK